MSLELIIKGVFYIFIFYVIIRLATYAVFKSWHDSKQQSLKEEENDKLPRSYEKEKEATGKKDNGGP